MTCRYPHYLTPDISQFLTVLRRPNNVKSRNTSEPQRQGFVELRIRLLTKIGAWQILVAGVILEKRNKSNKQRPRPLRFGNSAKSTSRVLASYTKKPKKPRLQSN
jgi:hypothetical protein